MDNRSPTAGDASRPAIVARDLTRHFGDVVAVDRASFEVGHGEVFGLLGHNGAGKTTTIRLLNGILAPTSGSAQVLGFEPVGDGARLRRHTGVLTATPALDGPLSVVENLVVYATICDVPDAAIPTRVDHLVDVLGLEDIAHTRVSELSTGLRQRVALARALVHDPAMLFLDEPTSALDPIAARGVRELIATLSRERGRTVVICTHNLREAQALCDRVAILDRGSVAAIGSTRELANQIDSGQRVRLRLDLDVATVRGAIDGLPGVIEVRCGPEATVDVVHDDRDLIPGIVRRLVEVGAAVYGVTEVTPSLEDVYVHLHERRQDPREVAVRTGER